MTTKTKLTVITVVEEIRSRRTGHQEAIDFLDDRPKSLSLFLQLASSYFIGVSRIGSCLPLRFLKPRNEYHSELRSDLDFFSYLVGIHVTSKLLNPCSKGRPLNSQLGNLF